MGARGSALLHRKEPMLLEEIVEDHKLGPNMWISVALDADDQPHLASLFYPEPPVCNLPQGIYAEAWGGEAEISNREGQSLK